MLSVPEAGRTAALVGVDEAAAVRAVVTRQTTKVATFRANRAAD